MQVNVRTTLVQNNNFITPESMLRGLLLAVEDPCNCGIQDTECECAEE
jgi:hypothetical protein